MRARIPRYVPALLLVKNRETIKSFNIVDSDDDDRLNSNYSVRNDVCVFSFIS